jgi:hypothetical protein
MSLSWECCCFVLGETVFSFIFERVWFIFEGATLRALLIRESALPFWTLPSLSLRVPSFLRASFRFILNASSFGLFWTAFYSWECCFILDSVSFWTKFCFHSLKALFYLESKPSHLERVFILEQAFTPLRVFAFIFWRVSVCHERVLGFISWECCLFLRAFILNAFASFFLCRFILRVLLYLSVWDHSERPPVFERLLFWQRLGFISFNAFLVSS